MRAVVQRVSKASVLVDSQVVGRIERGFLVLLGIHQDDDAGDVEYLVDKIAGLRVFPDADGKMNLGLAEVGGAVLAVSQFTLYGDCRRGRRPSYSEAARPEVAIPLYERFVRSLRERGLPVETGVFGAMMEIELVNAGPVTLLLDSKKLF